MNYTPKQLAKLCGVSCRSIYSYAEKIGIQKNGGRWIFTPGDAQRIASYYNKKLQNEPLAEEKEPFTEKEVKETEKKQEQNEKTKKPQVEPKNEAGTDALTEHFGTLIASLEAQLDKKDRQIEKYEDTISELLAEQKRATNERENLIKQIENLIGNVSLLNAADKRDLLTQGDTQEQAEVIEVKQAQEQQIQEHETRSMTRWEHLRAFFTGK